MRKYNLHKMSILAALCLLTPICAPAADVVTSKHLFQKDRHVELKLRECENGSHPIVIAYNDDPKKLIGPSIPIVEHVMQDQTNYFTVSIEEDTEGVVAQFCDFKTIKPYFDSLKEPGAENSSK